MSGFMRAALAVVIIGALNWGLVGFFNFDIVASLFGGQQAFAAKVLYAIIGLSGLAALGLLFKPNERSAVVEEKKEESIPTFDGIRNVNYNTEFGEELDFEQRKRQNRRKRLEDEEL